MPIRRITSYINNLHPVRHKELYSVIEDIIPRIIPVWNATLTPMKLLCLWPVRIAYEAQEFEDIPDDEFPQREDYDDDDLYDERRRAYWKENRKVIQPEP